MIFENQINVIDLIALLITLLSTLASTWRGLIKETLTIIVWILSLIISNGLFIYTKVHIEKFTEIEILIKVLSWSIPFISSVIILSIVTRVLLLPLILTFSNILDHLLGLFFGLIRGVLLLCFIFAGLMYVVESNDKLPLSVQKSYSVKIVRSLTIYILPMLPNDYYVMLEDKLKIK